LSHSVGLPSPQSSQKAAIATVGDFVDVAAHPVKVFPLLVEVKGPAKGNKHIGQRGVPAELPRIYLVTS